MGAPGLRCEDVSERIQGLYSCGRDSRRLTVGRYGLLSAEQARHKAAQVIDDINAGSKPVLDSGASSASAAPTVADVAE